MRYHCEIRLLYVVFLDERVEVDVWNALRRVGGGVRGGHYEEVAVPQQMPPHECPPFGAQAAHHSGPVVAPAAGAIAAVMALDDTIRTRVRVG